MPDITMCRNTKCILKEKCYRFKAKPNPHRQSYSSFTPDKRDRCDGFVKIE